jgi:hypothetical protein
MIGTYVNGYANASLCSAGVPHGYSISGYTLTDKEILLEMQMNKVVLSRSHMLSAQP